MHLPAQAAGGEEGGGGGEGQGSVGHERTLYPRLGTVNTGRVRRIAATLTALFAAAALAGPQPEVQLCLTHLRDGERASAEAALGPLDRLPLYQAEVEVDPAARTAQGRLRLRYFVDGQPLKALYLRATPNAFEGASLKISGAALDGKPIRVDQPEPSLFKLALEAPAPVGAELTFELEFRARVPKADASAEDASALTSTSHRGDHGAFSAAPDVMSLVGVLPAVPLLDAAGEPAEAAPTGIGDLATYAPAHYLVSISVPPGYRAIATGAALGEVPEPGGRVRFAFGAAAARDFPLLVARGFEVASRKAGDLTVESYYSPKSAAAGKRALEIAASSVAQYERRLGRLPYRVIRVVEAPLTGGAGGMEFSGLVTIARSLYRGVASPGSAMAQGQLAGVLKELADQGFPLDLPTGAAGGMLAQALELTVAHEIAHQYFAGLVGSDPVGSPIADETLAQYLAVVYLEAVHGKEAAGAVIQGQLVASYQLYRMMGGKDGPADRPTTEYDDEMQYAALVYGKAPLLHREERRLLGDAAFFAGLRAYVDEYRFRWACGDCLTRTLSRLNPSQAKALHLLRRRWWEEAHGDEDLGQLDLSALNQLGGGDLGPEVLELLKQLPGALGGP